MYVFAPDPLSNFNPHSREGSDGAQEVKDLKGRVISIHTPAKGVTWVIWMYLKQMRFQSTLPRRE